MKPPINTSNRRRSLLLHWLPPLLRLTLVILVAILLLGNSSMPPGDPLEKARAYTRQIEFDFIGWTFDALRLKFLEASIGTTNYLSEEERHEWVLDYLNLACQIFRKEWELEQIYANPEIDDPRAYSTELRKELAGLYARREQTTPLVESILQSQISYVIAEEGLSLAGQPFPPVLYHSTPLPLILIISPRDVIRLDESIALNGDLPIDARDELEQNVDQALDVSSLVENIGGLGLYPTMVDETCNLNWLTEVIAHEWTHNFLSLRPLGINYGTSPELRVINETVASLTGKEISRAVLERFYPELIPAEVVETPSSEAPKPAEPPKFNFNKEMQITRVKTDQLLAEGKIEEAEQYMEDRRQVFWENGYTGLRKINQAYFAFHGAYADEPGGAAGVTEDPIGAAVRLLRAESASLADFLNRISWMTSFEQLQKAVSDED